jgi:hypothetical protein
VAPVAGALLGFVAEEHRHPVGRPVFKTGVTVTSRQGGSTPPSFAKFSNAPEEGPEMTLQAKLDQIKQGAMQRIPADTLAVMEGATKALRASGILDGVIRVGSRLPPFALANQNGAVIRSEDLLQRGAIVLTVFRGHW